MNIIRREIKYLALIFISFFQAYSVKAQNVGIGTRSPHASALLEVSANVKNGGVLMPKVSLTSAIDVSTIPSPAIGLMVYNTVNAGVKPDQVQANHHYFWNGSRWTDLADINIIKNLLLPQVFFCQEPTEQEISGLNLISLNSGNDVLVTFNNVYTLTNNGSNITLANNMFLINNTGEYEVSGYINYNPYIIGNTINNTNLLYKLQKSTNGGTSWTTVGQTISVWGKESGGFSRTLIAPPSVIQFNKNDLLRLVITKTYGTPHGGASANNPRISLPGGLSFSKNIRILKLD